ncbi:isoflavone reductase family protein [Aspergillus terreus]|uniref:Isoflavone reductase family protein n=1 Tax=Aspergillus terreus TaxID=33178 RepID=A0A5M3YZ94_ASPTE|nr:hypothetical protein ATETN484_0006028400 [Aspergillus terreus]GFF20024.1 isoflavone reductase family protein [Aspergillus terreus]
MKVAVAGGTGTIGASIVSALASRNHTPIILSRKNDQHSDGTTSTSPAGIEVRYVDYASKGSLVRALQGVSAVISALLIPGPEFVPYQINLLHAAEEAGCARFAPSEFALSLAAHHEVDLDHAKIVVWDEVKAAMARKTIDAALFPCGMFMNYLGIGAPRAEEALAGFSEGPLMFHLNDPQGPWVEVPVQQDGSFPTLTMTDIRDVGRFVVAALEMEEPWGGRELGMAGDVIGLGEVIELCERYVGKKIEVRAFTQAQLDERLRGFDPSDILARLDCQYTMLCGRGGSVVKPVLNALCPHVHPTSVKDFLEKYWA